MEAMKGMTATLTRRASWVLALTLILSLVQAIMFAPQANAAPGEKVTLCHAAGQEGTLQFVTITVPYNAAFGQAGHFNEDGTPKAGHEHDYLGACESDPDDPDPDPEISFEIGDCDDGERLVTASVPDGYDLLIDGQGYEGPVGLEPGSYPWTLEQQDETVLSGTLEVPDCVLISVGPCDGDVRSVSFDFPDGHVLRIITGGDDIDLDSSGSEPLPAGAYEWELWVDDEVSEAPLETGEFTVASCEEPRQPDPATVSVTATATCTTNDAGLGSANINVVITPGSGATVTFNGEVLTESGTFGGASDDTTHTLSVVANGGRVLTTPASINVEVGDCPDDPDEVLGTTVVEVSADTLPFTGSTSGEVARLGILTVISGALLLLAAHGSRKEEDEVANDIGGWSSL